VAVASDPRVQRQDDRSAARNARTARWLLLWIAFLMLVSLAVIWVRN